MESILFTGDDSDESDTEPQPVTQPSESRQSSEGPGAVTKVSTGSMSQSEMAQRLKRMYSPASKAGSGSAVQAVVTSPKAVSTQPVPSVPSISQPTHRLQQQIQQPQKAPSAVASYRPSTSAGESAQHQQRGAITQQSQRSNNQQQQLQRRPGSGIPHQQTTPNSGSMPHPSERPVIHQMQAPSIPHRPSVRHNPHGQPQSITSSTPTHAVQQITTPRLSSHSTTSTSSQQQQQSQQISTMDRSVMEKKQKERFLVFTRVLMVRIHC
jgi:hypothetical protein